METSRSWIITTCLIGILANGIVDAVHEFTHAHVNRHHHTANRHTEDGIKCRLRNTMAWRECDQKLVCYGSCRTETDCMFPYCNARRLCECIQAFCKTDRMCYSFGISCRGNFTCINRHCFCNV